MSREEHLIQNNLRKIEELKKQGINPYPYRYDKKHYVEEILEKFKEGKNVKTAGRVMTLRHLGKIAFAKLQDETAEMQLIFSAQHTKNFELVKKYLLRGDIIGVEGRCILSKTGEKSIQVEDFVFLSKVVRTLPEKYHGIQDPEYRYRHRYLDFILNPQKRNNLRIRSQVIKELRAFLDKRGFLEVDTPILQPVYGGAYAKPFVTYYNALERNFYLRIAPELYLKRLLIAGFEKVYELGKNFRNEGIDATHNPEFMSLEFYQAYADIYDMKDLTEELIKHVVKKVSGSLKIEYQGEKLNFSKFDVLTMEEALKKYADIDVNKMSEKEMKNLLTKKDIMIRDESRGYLIAKLFEEEVEHKLIQPTFIMDYPKEVTPLAKDHRSKPGFVERFELFIAGIELANAFSELNDPVEQRKRFEYELEQRQKGEEEAHPLDTDFIKALEYGMPPAGGCGIGVERLVLLLANETSIRETIPFPALRTKE
ncbi:MAG: lysine--tRNA ligase [Candidatus Nanohaloarchaeota archaeon]|nr:lysine--tRNA ligase [Candidatus Nanohaloarchaeota archaeon]